VRNAISMRIDLDESLGKLHFVRDLVPDAALVFWNMGAGDMAKPVNGQLSHPTTSISPGFCIRPAARSRCAPHSLARWRPPRRTPTAPGRS
jgi:hypothetical protein